MNKKINRIIAAALVISAFSAVAPVNNFNFFTESAYASTDSSYKLTDLELETSSGSDIRLYEKSNYRNKLDSGDTLRKTYYAKAPSSKSKVKVSRADSTKGDVRIFKGNSSKAYEEDENISLSSGRNTLYVRIYDGYDNDTRKNDYKAEYKIVVARGSSSSRDDDDDDKNDDIYLDDITLNGGDIGLNFRKKTSSYDVKVKESLDEIIIKAEPKDEDDTVRVNGDRVDSKYRKRVSLDKGKNKIEITVEDDDDNERTYTLNVTRGTSSSNDDDSDSTTDKKINQWVNSNGIWKYNDSLGNELKNTWFYDRNAAKNFYLQADGSMATGWLYNNGHWYYLNPISNGYRGAMQTGWQYVSGAWYYLDASGAMQTGWFKDRNGAWYYLNSNGAMQTTPKYIDGKLYSFYQSGAMK